MSFDEAKWAYLTKKYPERAGVAYDMYLRDKKKTANITTYFMWAGKRIQAEEMAYKKNLQKYLTKQLQGEEK